VPSQLSGQLTYTEYTLLCTTQEKKAKEREQQQEEEQADMDPDMMAMMGFGGFGSSKK
jgi:hypothetical protein